MKLPVAHPQAEVGCLVTGPAPILAADTSIRKAATALRTVNASAALVEGAESIVTERDLTKAWSHGLTGDEPVTSVASDHPIVVNADMPVIEAAALMLSREVRHLLVIDGSQVGIVSLRVVMAVLLQAVQPELWLTSLRVAITETPELWIG